MVNLFRRMPAEQGSLTAALLALLEHSDRELLNGLFRRAEIPYQLPADTEIQVDLHDDSPTPRGIIAAPHFSVTLFAQAPGETIEAADPTGTALAITPTGKAPEGVHALSWEQVDRWLAQAEEQYSAESRTGFLVRQFRSFLPEAGIEYFAGFPADQVEAAPGALATLTRFYEDAARFLDRLAPALPQGISQVRQARAEDMLAGYSYRDYAGAPLGPTSFLRVAFHLGQKELQVSLWLPSTRLRDGLSKDTQLLPRLTALEEHPLLWLWSTAGERKIPLEETTPESLSQIDWDQYQTGIQRSLAFVHLSGEGLVPRVAELIEGLTAVLLPVINPVLH